MEKCGFQFLHLDLVINAITIKNKSFHRLSRNRWFRIAPTKSGSAETDSQNVQITDKLQINLRIGQSFVELLEYKCTYIDI